MHQVTDRRIVLAEREELLCECGSPDCTARLPLDAEQHRHGNGRLLVAPGHLGLQPVVRAADRFFVIQPRQRETTS